MFRARKLNIRLLVENATSTGVVVLVHGCTICSILTHGVFFVAGSVRMSVVVSVCVCVLIRSITLTLSIIARKTASTGVRD